MFFELIALFLAPPICWLLEKWLSYRSFQVNEKRMALIFSKFWSGRSADQASAWRETAEYIKTKEGHRKEIAYALQKAAELEDLVEIKYSGPDRDKKTTSVN